MIYIQWQDRYPFLNQKCRAYILDKRVFISKRPWENSNFYFGKRVSSLLKGGYFDMEISLLSLQGASVLSGL